jgi:hypothetical protein
MSFMNFIKLKNFAILQTKKTKVGMMLLNQTHSHVVYKYDAI